MSNPVADIFRQGAALNADDPRRVGNVVDLEENADVIVTGDLHGNREALAKIIRFSSLDPHTDPPRRLILQEIVHGPIDARTGHDRSIEVLLRAVRLRLANPQGVLFVMGNHDVAEITGNEITRDGQPSCKSFAAGVDFAFGEHGAEILDAVKEFARSMPLAIRCPNGVLISHSLPDSTRMNEACYDILDRPYRPEDFMRGGPVYEWTWGRKHSREHLDELADRLDIEFFVIGHLHTPTGYHWVGPRAVTLASDHDQACLMRFGAHTPLTSEAAAEAIKELASVR